MKQWAEQTLPKLKEHLTKATGLAGTKTGAPKAGTTKGSTSSPSL